MEVVITAVGPDTVGLVDSIVHYVTGAGANIAEVQMYDHDADAVFAMYLRIAIDAGRFEDLQQAILGVGQ